MTTEVTPEYIKVVLNNQELSFHNTPTAPVLVNEIFRDNYKIFDRKVPIRDGDVIVDIGANEGIFSILMAKLFPNSPVYSFEPVPRTFFQMIRNIGLNGITNIQPYNLGIGGSTHSDTMNVHKEFSGGSSLVDTFDPINHEKVNVELISLDEAFSTIIKSQHIRLMKMDIEGGEYEAIYNSSILNHVDYFVGEFHINSKLEAKGYDINELATWVGSKTNLVYFERCRMNE